MAQRASKRWGLGLHLPDDWFAWMNPRWPTARRLIVFLWMWRIDFWTEKTWLTCDETAGGWNLSLWTPMFNVEVYSLFPVLYMYDTLQTAVYIGWVPRKWWGIADGDLVMKYTWEKVWRRWMVLEEITSKVDGSGYVATRYLTEIQPSESTEIREHR